MKEELRKKKPSSNRDRSRNPRRTENDRYEKRNRPSSSTKRRHPSGTTVQSTERRKKRPPQRQVARKKNTRRPVPYVPSKKKKAAAWVYNLFFYLLTTGLILSSVMFAFSDKNEASLFGYRFYNVLTNSMAPRAGSPAGGFYAGDMTLVKLVDPATLKEGDIITYRVGSSGNRYLTHRLVGRLDELNGEKGDYLVTQGDANDVKDPPFPADRVLGKVEFAIPKVGAVLEFVRTKENFWLCLLFLCSTFGFFLVLKAYLFSDP